jgi:hypothetical protein
MIIVTYSLIVEEVIHDILPLMHKCICESQNVVGEKSQVAFITWMCPVESGDIQMDIHTYIHRDIHMFRFGLAMKE